MRQPPRDFNASTATAPSLAELIEACNAARDKMRGILANLLCAAIGVHAGTLRITQSDLERLAAVHPLLHNEQAGKLGCFDVEVCPWMPEGTALVVSMTIDILPRAVPQAVVNVPSLVALMEAGLPFGPEHRLVESEE